MDEKEITKVLSKFYGDFVEPEIKEIKGEIKEIKGQQKITNSEIKEIKGQQEKFQIGLEGVQLELKEVNKKQQEHDEKFDRLFGQMDGLCGQFKRLETEYYSIRHALIRIEDKIDKEIEERKVLKEEVRWIKGELVMLLGRVEDFEEKLKKAA
ncbi:MAG: hypothetical protein ABIF11_09050 [Nitrospirota bacterium]